MNRMRASGARTFVVSIRARDAMASYRLLEVSLYDEHVRLQAVELRPDGPADPLDCMAIVFTTPAVSGSNLTLCHAGEFPLSSMLGSAGELGGCLLSRTSRTVEILPLMVRLSPSSHT